MSVSINPEVDQSQVTILVVDDIPLNVLLIRKMLGKFKFNILTANNGQAALDTVAANNVDLVLLDLMMPGMDGYEVLTRLRNQEETKELPVVILSALNSSDDVTKGFQLGANDFITKPIIMERLLTCVATQANQIWEKRNP
ncbi:MAG: response regulator [Prevotellaceae bacterium]|nr:response regulator [Prevotella sp.]MDD7248006.1 response regulator [Prevotellaceae bacterium]MDY2749285.1 response regulator [Prevotella sp.]